MDAGAAAAGGKTDERGSANLRLGLVRWTRPILAITWFSLAAVAIILFAVHLHSLIAFRFPLLGRGLSAAAAAFGLALAAFSAVSATGFLRDRPLIRRFGGAFVLLELLVSVSFAALLVADALRAFLFLRASVHAVLLWLAAGKEPPLRTPLANRDLLVVLYVVLGTTGALGLVYGIGIFQFLINGLVVGSIYVLGATGLSLVFGIRKFANFAHGEMMTFGAYMAFLVNTVWLLDILLGFVLAILATAALGMAMELLVFRRLAARGPVSALVASIGITIFLNNLIALSFGTSIHVYNLRAAVNIVLLEVDGRPVLSLNPVKGIATLVISTALILFLHFLLSRTTLGKAMRATADNPDLARSSGIKIRNVMLWTWAIAGALAAVAGVLLGIVLDVRTTLGFNVLLFVFAAVIIGGLGSPYGAMLGGLIVGVAQELSVALLAYVGRPDVLNVEQAIAYKPVAAFLIMILVMLLRPGGLAMGKAQVLRVRGRRLFTPRLARREAS